MKPGWLLIVITLAAFASPQAVTIHEAIDQGDSAAVAAMLDANLSLLTERAPNTRTPLHTAAYGGKLGIVQLLISRGAEVNATTTTGSTPLHGAALAGLESAVKQLVEKGANVNAINQYGYTPLTNASSSGNLPSIKFLVESGANVNKMHDSAIVPLLCAINSCNPEVVEYLLGAGADPKAVSSEGESAVAQSVFATMWKLPGHENQPAILQALVNRGADVNRVLNNGHTPLMLAARGSDTAMLRVLVDAGANTAMTARSGATAFGEAVGGGRIDAARYLAAKGAKADALDTVSGRTPLHYAVLLGLAPLVETVFPLTAHPNLIDSTGRTPLDIALRYGHTRIADLLQKGGAVASSDKRSPVSSTFFAQKPAEGEAYLWYLGNCGYLVKTRNHCLIFDYWTRDSRPTEPSLSNGFIKPSEIASEDVTVFVTHEHQDHFDSVIFGWPGQIPKLQYVFGFHPDSLEEGARQGYAGQPYEYVGPSMTKTIDGMQVMAVRSNDAGVGFVIRVDGLTIYHAGDLAGWVPGERDGFISQIDSIDAAVDSVDIALVNVTGCHHQDTLALAEGTEYTITKLQPKLVIPTHGFMREHYYRHFMSKFASKFPDLKSFCPVWRGDAARYTGGSKPAKVELL